MDSGIAPLEPSPEDFASILYAEPGALGLIANIMAGLTVAVENMLFPPFSTVSLAIAGECFCSLRVLYS